MRYSLFHYGLCTARSWQLYDVHRVFFFLKIVKALKFFKVYNHHNGIQYKTLPRIEQCQVMSSIKLAFIIVSLHLR